MMNIQELDLGLGISQPILAIQFYNGNSFHREPILACDFPKIVQLPSKEHGENIRI